MVEQTVLGGRELAVARGIQEEADNSFQWCYRRDSIVLRRIRTAKVGNVSA